MATVSKTTTPKATTKATPKVETPKATDIFGDLFATLGEGAFVRKASTGNYVPTGNPRGKARDFDRNPLSIAEKFLTTNKRGRHGVAEAWKAVATNVVTAAQVVAACVRNCEMSATFSYTIDDVAIEAFIADSANLSDKSKDEHNERVIRDALKLADDISTPGSPVYGRESVYQAVAEKLCPSWATMTLTDGTVTFTVPFENALLVGMSGKLDRVPTPISTYVGTFETAEGQAHLGTYLAEFADETLQKLAVVSANIVGKNAGTDRAVGFAAAILSKVREDGLAEKTMRVIHSSILTGA